MSKAQMQVSYLIEKSAAELDLASGLRVSSLTENSRVGLSLHEAASHPFAVLACLS